MKQRRNRPWTSLLFVALALIGGECVGMASAPEPDIEYDVQMAEPQTHYFDVTITVTGLHRQTMDFVLPVWTPGSYLIRDYARHVTTFSATDGQGVRLPVRKTNKTTWRVESRGAERIIARYRVYAFDENMRESYLDESHAYINGPSLFMYVDGYVDHPVRLRIHPSPGWDTISTGLDPVPGEKWVFQAPNYDALVDCPIEIGQHPVYEFAVQGVPHRIAIYGVGNYEPERLMADVRRIVEAARALFGELPYRHYTFIVHLMPSGGGGIEHANSASLSYPRWGFSPESSYQRWLSLVAHEFFHLWNVKRIRPIELGPFDYTRETPTRMLWVAEGFTSYYADRLLLRAGFISPDRYLDRLTQAIAELQSRPGRFVQSVAEASFDAWIKFYRPDENSRNTTVSYYNKGKILAALLDLEIRHRTGGRRSLDDVMRHLYTEFYKKRNVGYTEEDFRRVCQEVAGGDLSAFFDHYVYGTSEIDYDRFLRHAGLRLQRTEIDERRGYLGIGLRNENGRAVVASVVANTPAERYGVYVGDEILAIDGWRVGFDNYAQRLGTKKPGQSVVLTINRKGRVRTLDVVLGRRMRIDYHIVRLDEVTAEQDALYRRWVLESGTTRMDGGRSVARRVPQSIQ